jgi:NADH dehydrogenase FAD-containing subunit
MEGPAPRAARPRVVIAGGGFGGLAVARGLRRTDAGIILLDRTNHHLFQPLLYQVATAILTPGQIAAPLRQVLSRQKNATVLMAEVRGVDVAGRAVIADLPGNPGVRCPFDHLVIATGMRQGYFGHEEFARHAPGLKTMPDATAVRNRLLRAFEAAEAEPDPARRRELLTIVLVGGGPTGVEMAGAIAELARLTMWRDFRRIDPRTARILLVESGPRLLAAFDPALSRKVERRLRRMGVEVLTNAPVEMVDEEGVTAGGQRLRSQTVIWTAGVAATPVARWLGARADPAGRVMVNGDLTAGAHHGIYVIGDVAHFLQDGRPLPGVAQVALQQGAYVARAIAARLNGPVALPVFRYRNRGDMAVVGRNYAVLELGRLKLAGFLAWLLWSTLHILYLALPNLRVSVFVQWVWQYVTRQRGSRLIVEP